jgi:hypothetical protein
LIGSKWKKVGKNFKILISSRTLPVSTMKRLPKDLALSLGDLLSGEDPAMFTVSQASHSMIKLTQMTLNKAYAVTATSFLVCLPWPKILKG